MGGGIPASSDLEGGHNNFGGGGVQKNFFSRGWGNGGEIIKVLTTKIFPAKI